MEKLRLLEAENIYLNKNMRLGTLEFLEAKEHKELLALVVASAIEQLSNAEIGVAEIDPNVSELRWTIHTR